MLKARLRELRYVLPGHIERRMDGQSPQSAASSLVRLARGGFALTAGYFARAHQSPGEVAETYCELARALTAAGGEAILALKAPALGYDGELVARIASAGLPLAFDSLASDKADGALALTEAFGAGAALPARWPRSIADAERLRDGPCRVRLVKGEWAAPDGDVADVAQAYRHLARILAGRRAPVGVATHDPALARVALTTLLEAGTPCELEQLRGLPRRRTTAVARQLGVGVRLYYPFGPGWLPYAVDKALARPYLPVWMAKDLVGAG